MSRSALIAALTGQDLQRQSVPWLPYIGVYAARCLDMTTEAYATNADAVVRGTIATQERLAADGLPVLAGFPLEYLALGGRVRWTPDAPAEPLLPILAQWQMGDALPAFPDARDGLYPVLRQALAELTSQIGESVVLVGTVTGPATLAYQLRGLKIFGDMVTQPPVAHALFAFAGQVAARAADLLSAWGCPVIALVDTAATMLKPDVYTEYITPNLQPAFRTIAAHQGAASLWGCGEANRVIAQMAATGTQSLAIDDATDLQATLAATQIRRVGAIGNIPIALADGTFEVGYASAIACLNLLEAAPYSVLGLGGPLLYHVSERWLDGILSARQRPTLGTPPSSMPMQ